MYNTKQWQSVKKTLIYLLVSTPTSASTGTLDTSVNKSTSDQNLHRIMKNYYLFSYVGSQYALISSNKSGVLCINKCVTLKNTMQY